MAAGNFILYQHGIQAILRGDIDHQSTTLTVALVSAGYTPSQASHSAWTQVSTYEVTTTGYAARNIAGGAVDLQSNSHVRFDANDITLSATDVMTAKYAVLRAQGSGVPIGYVDLDTGSSSGVDATQITVQWNANGIYRINQSI